jgi:hypothetical protein
LIVALAGLLESKVMKQVSSYYLFMIALAAGIPLLQAAQPGEISRETRHHLFNPKPKDALRDLSTDRPDLTESPYTVDAGHVQWEIDLFNATYDRTVNQGESLTTDSRIWGGLNFKLGLLDQVDLQTIVPIHVDQRTKSSTPGQSQRKKGTGDLTTRLKINLWGNDGGRTAMAIIPFVTFPTGADQIGQERTTGGVVLPFAVELKKGWSLGAQTEVDWVEDEGNGLDTQWFNTLTIGHAIVGNLAGYTEWAARMHLDSDQAWEGQWNVGLTYAISSEIQLDGGCNFGITSSAPDANPFLGLSMRF